MDRFDDVKISSPTVEGLNYALPRKVRLSDSGSNFLKLAVMVIVAGAVVLTVACHTYSKQMRQRETLRREGRDSIGDVTAIGRSRSGVWVDYTYRVDGLAYRGASLLPDDPRINPSKGSHIPIRYLYSDPSISHPGEWEWSVDKSDIVIFLLLQIFPGLGGVVLVVLYRQRELAREGWVVQGKVTGCAPNRTRFRIYYEFHTDTGALIEGSNDYANEYQYGAPILVIYLRARPTRNDCLPLAYFCAL